MYSLNYSCSFPIEIPLQYAISRANELSLLLNSIYTDQP